MKLQNETKLSRKIHGRWYDDACGAAFAMELIGERWTLLILRELMLGGRRFSDIRFSLPGLSAKVLAERLESLEAVGVVTREELPPPAPARLYVLTEWGRGLERAMLELVRWAVQSPMFDPRLPLTPVALMLSMRTMIDAEAAQGWSVVARMEVGQERFVARLADGRLQLARVGTDKVEPDIIFAAANANAYLPVLYGKQPLGGPGVSLRAEGDPAVVQRFIDLFNLPDRPSPPA